MKRQGDLLILPVKDIPSKAKKINHTVLAEGELAGHLHELDGGLVYEHKGVFYFHVSEQAVQLNHPEHETITFKPGKYKVIRQREYEPGNWRYVQD